MPKESDPLNRQEYELLKPLFETGEIFVTGGAAIIASASGGIELIQLLIERHAAHDFGTASVNRVNTNFQALSEGAQIVSVYPLPSGEILFVTTLPDRTITVVQTADEFAEGNLPMFQLGKIYLALEGQTIVENNGGLPLVQTLLSRHQTGDFGDLDPEDIATNHRALRVGARIFSSYILESGEKLWVITEHDRSLTTILTPSEY